GGRHGGWTDRWVHRRGRARITADPRAEGRRERQRGRAADGERQRRSEMRIGLVGRLILLMASAFAPAGDISARTDARAARRISLDLQDADVLGVLRLLAEGDRINVAATDDVKGKGTLHLNPVPWDQAPALALRPGP